MVAGEARWKEFAFFGPERKKFRTYKDAERKAKELGYVNIGRGSSRPDFKGNRKALESREDEKVKGEMLKDYRRNVMDLGEIRS